jgi:uridylate kinase
MKYRRVLLKLSGESLAGSSNQGIDLVRLHEYADQIKEIRDLGTQVAIVIGGGNIFRGVAGQAEGFDRLTGDYMGMLATVINCLGLQTILEKKGTPCKLLTGLHLYPMAEKFYGPKAIEYLEKGNVLLLGGGTGNPYFTTDSASALRAVEIKAEAMLKGTRVDGVYSDDPEKNFQAVRYSHLTFREAYEKELKIMDLTAFTLCEENNLPIVVFDMNTQGNLRKVIEGQSIGTIITPSA